jgi:hypothetical protein
MPLDVRDGRLSRFSPIVVIVPQARWVLPTALQGSRNVWMLLSPHNNRAQNPDGVNGA